MAKIPAVRGNEHHALACTRARARAHDVIGCGRPRRRRIQNKCPPPPSHRALAASCAMLQRVAAMQQVATHDTRAQQAAPFLHSDAARAMLLQHGEACRTILHSETTSSVALRRRATRCSVLLRVATGCVLQRAACCNRLPVATGCVLQQAAWFQRGNRLNAT